MKEKASWDAWKVKRVNKRERERGREREEKERDGEPAKGMEGGVCEVRAIILQKLQE